MVDISEILALFPPVTAIGYAVLLLYLLAWGSRPGQRVRAFGGYLAVSAAWVLLLGYTEPETAFNAPVKLLAAGTLCWPLPQPTISIGPLAHLGLGCRLILAGSILLDLPLRRR